MLLRHLLYDGKYHTKQLKSGKSCKTCLTNHMQSISHHIMPLVINALEGGHTQRHTDMGTKAISRNQVCAGLWLVHAWFKKFYEVDKIASESSYKTLKILEIHNSFS